MNVTITRGFWMGKYEATQGEWRRIAGDFIREMDKGAGDDFPMYWVNHAEAEGFCRNITALAQASGELPKDWEFRLPTEAQWEYACRAGTTTATYLGKSMTEAQANFGHRSGQSDKVGSIPQTRGDCTTWSVTCGSGAATGTTSRGREAAIRR